MDKNISKPIGRIRLPLTLADVAESLSKLETEHGAGVQVRMVGVDMVVFTEGESCGCTECLDLLDEFTRPADSWMSGVSRHMVVCSICGNKRCPHALSHTYVCNHSNEPGQEPVVLIEEESR